MSTAHFALIYKLKPLLFSFFFLPDFFKVPRFINRISVLSFPVHTFILESHFNFFGAYIRFGNLTYSLY